MAAPVPPPPPGADPLNIALAIFGGVSALGTFIVWIVKSLGARVVQREDDDKKALAATNAALSAKLEHVSETLASIKADMRMLTAEVSATRGQLTETRQTLDQRIEKAGLHHQTELAKLRDELRKEMSDLEFRLRGDFTRAIADSKLKGRGRS